ncbi:MAG: polysaccharide biosynthesis protein [Clostridia bacterium]|nr:polysaccharide biosynthesis protein [Clostridia bacterium]
MNSKDTKQKGGATSERLHRVGRQWIIGLYDLVIYCAVAILLLVIYDGSVALKFNEVLYQFVLSGAFILVSRLIFRVYNQIWRYGGIQCFIRLLLADGVAFIAYYLVERLLDIPLNITHASFPRILSISCMTLLGSLAIRMCYRYAYKCCKRDTKLGKLMCVCLRIFAGKKILLEENTYNTKINVAIVGAGNVGVGLAEELLNNKNSTYNPVFFIDTNAEKIGRQVFGLKVYSEETATKHMLRENMIQEIIFALPREDDEKKQALYRHYMGMGFKVKVYDFPVIQQAGTKKRHLREFDIEELLFRKPLDVTDKCIEEFYRDKVILITGGGGSIGSELCRQIAAMSPKRLIILDVYENGAYDIQQELRIAYGSSLDLNVEILSVCNRPALEKVFLLYRPQVVLHAAAHKHVPLMEHNCCEAIENNVFGTLNTVELSEKYGVERFMMVSTDKAVNPTNVMGATKRMCETIVQSHSATSKTTTYSCTRFGNVLGSAGSVIPLFKKQILKGGPITLTDKRIIRYFMTIPEASQLVLQSAAMAKNGELFVLDMGKPIKILDLAESMIKLSGYEPYKDIDIIETGLRPGEKLYEELLVKTEKLTKTKNSLIFIEKDHPVSPDVLSKKLALLRIAVERGDDEAAREALREAVSTFKTPEEVNADASQSDEIKMAEKTKV